MQTAWREDYSHREARYFLQGMEWIDLLLASPLALVDSLIKNGPGIAVHDRGDCLNHPLPAAFSEKRIESHGIKTTLPQLSSLSTEVASASRRKRHAF
jgi:hypothetical protein